MDLKETAIERIKRDDIQEQIYRSGVALTNHCHEIARECGWCETTNNRDIPLPGRKMIEVELADTVIRIFDMAGGLKLDVAGAIRDKLVYNATREDHKLEVRASGGKSY